MDKRYYRPTEVESLIGDASKARETLGWQPVVGFDALVREMVACDLDEARQHDLLLKCGFAVRNFHEQACRTSGILVTWNHGHLANSALSHPHRDGGVRHGMGVHSD